MITHQLIEKIQKSFHKLSLRFDVPWGELTTLGVGGAVPLMVEPHDDIAMASFLKFCRDEDCRVMAVGAGSNLVGSDDDFDGIVIRLSQPAFTNIRVSHVHVTAGAGARLYDFFMDCAHAGLGGPASVLAGIPGTLGGALRMNAGRHDAAIGQIVEDLCGLDPSGDAWSSDGKSIEWSYRKSTIPSDVIITAAIFKLEKVGVDEALSTLRQSVAKTRTAYPKFRNAGCFFRNPPSGHGAGKLLDVCGAKGMSCGGAEISHEHANFLINKSQATESDMTLLASAARAKVFQSTGILLQPEAEFVNPASMATVLSSAPRLRILVLGGGDSNERAVSLESSTAVAKALAQAGHCVELRDVSGPDVDVDNSTVDVVFPVLHGGFGEDGTLQKRLETLGVPFVGCGSIASRIVMDKVETKRLLESHCIPTPGSAVIELGDDTLPASLPLPVIVKPPADGSTYGMTVVRVMEQWPAALAEARRVGGGRVLVESFIEAVETTVGVLDGKALEVVEIQYPGEIYDYDAKYLHEKGETRYFCPPINVSEEVKSRMMKIAERCFQIVGAKDMLRVDILVSKNTGEPYVIEMNSIPGFTSSSLLPKTAAAVGIPFIQLCATLAKNACPKWKQG